VNKELLIVYTASFPYGKGETFFENELPILAKEFENILIIPMTDKVGVEDRESIVYKNINRIDSLPKNCKVEMIPSSIGLYRGGKAIFKNTGKLKLLKSLFGFIPLLAYVAYKDFNSFKSNKREFISYLFYLYLRAKEILSYIENLPYNNIIHYSYFMYEWVTLLSILKYIKKIKFLIARGHGNDIYEENYGSFDIEKRKKLGEYIIRYRNFELENIDRLYLVSKYMKNYMLQKYPKYSDRFKLSYLGVPYRGANPATRDVFRIVSVSNVIPLKRVDRVIEVLKYIDFKVEWVHFGSGPLFDKLEQDAKKLMDLKENIKITLYGRVPNSEVMDYYKSNHVTLFINVSITEGLPVSIMEALSMAIPVVATDAGGTKEALTRSEFLLPVDFCNEDLKKLLYMLYYLNEDDYNRLKRESFEKFKTLFDSKNNYNLFVEDIKNLYINRNTF